MTYHGRLEDAAARVHIRRTTYSVTCPCVAARIHLLCTTYRLRLVRWIMCCLVCGGTALHACPLCCELTVVGFVCGPASSDKPDAGMWVGQLPGSCCSTASADGGCFLGVCSPALIKVGGPLVCWSSLVHLLEVSALGHCVAPFCPPCRQCNKTILEVPSLFQHLLCNKIKLHKNMLIV